MSFSNSNISDYEESMTESDVSTKLILIYIYIF